jgi:anti-anti-sigma factor
MHQGLQIEILVHGTDLVISGRLDSRAAPIARAVLHAAVEAGDGDLTVRVGELEIWDGVGMGVLVGVHGMARRRQRRLVLVDVPPRQLRLLRATRLTRVLSVQPLKVA